MSAIPAASVNLKTMADGTLRISFDIEPMHAQDAFRLFAAPGTPAAIAALQVGYSAATGDALSPVEKPKGGPLSKLAGMWCNDPEFYNWINSTTHEGIMWPTHTSKDAADFVRELCEIESRADLDHDAYAAERFNRLIRGPYSKWLMARGIVK